jgi:hypothetical protein
MDELLRYPLKKLDKSDDYLKIDILKYQAPGLGFSPGSLALATSDDVDYGKKVPIKTIILPIPDGIGDSNGAQWGDSSIGPIAAAAIGTGGSLFDSKSLQDAGGSIKGIFEKVLKSATSGSTQQKIQAGAIGLAANALFGGNSNIRQGDLSSRLGGIVANSNIELIFQGLSFRQGFSFSFDMVPRSKKESEEIKKIIRAFKINSAVKKGAAFEGAAGLFLTAPNVFRIQYMSGANPHPFLNKFKICALRSMGVNYTGSGTYATYADATPVNMIMTLNFQELTPIFAEDYDTTNGSQGVGY